MVSDEPTRNTAITTRKWSKMVAPDEWETVEHSFSTSDDVPSGTDADSHGASLRTSVRAQVNAEMEAQRDEILRVYKLPSAPVVDINAALSEAEGGAQIDQDEAYLTAAGVPTDADLVKAGVQEKLRQTAQAMETPPQETRVPLDEQGNELRVFEVTFMVIAKTNAGDKYGQIYGHPWKRDWVPAWGPAMNLLFGDVESMDLGRIFPPYPVHAHVKMGEYEGRPSPDQIVGWEKI